MTAGVYRGQDVDPYDPSTRDLAPETPDMGRVLSEAMRQVSLGLRVAMPAAVTAVLGDQLVDVQPLFTSRYVGGRVAPLPSIPHALVCAPMGKGWGLRFPIAVGDTGMAVFVDRSLDAWASGSGGVVDPADCRAHDLCDAVFLPGLVPVSGQTTDGTTDMVLTNGKAQIRAGKDGRFKVTNGAVELVDQVAQLADAVASLAQLLQTQAFTLTALGPMPFIASTLAALSSQQQAAAALASNIRTLKGA